MALSFVLFFALLLPAVGCSDSSVSDPSADAQVSQISDTMDASSNEEPADAGTVFADIGEAQDSGSGVADAGEIYADAEIFPDAEISDTGPSPQSRCRVTYSGVVQYANFEPLIPMERRRIYQASLSSDLKRLYMTVELPNSRDTTWYSDDLYVLTRTGTSGPFTTSERANLDVDSIFSNQSHERDFRYVPSLDRFWYTESTPGGSELQIINTLMSVRQPDPMAPAEFDDFQVENLKLAEFDQTENFRMPSLTSDALIMVATKFPRFMARRYDLHEFRRSSNTADFELAERLAISSDTADDRYPWLSDDGLQLLFTSNRSPLGNKLYCSWRNGLDQPWQGPIPYGQIPEAAVLTHDFSASLVGGELYFVRVYPGERRSEFVRAVQ